jgi:undecaprenyl-diphosphatase
MRIFVTALDSRMMEIVQNWPSWLRPIMRSATFIGLPVFTITIGLIMAITGVLSGSASLLFAGVVIVGTIGVGSVLKLFFRRTRPLTDYVVRMRFSSFSLPSGHAVGGVVTYGALGYLIAAPLASSFSVIIFTGGLLVAFLIGTSRVYLGAHYPSDVVAGWLLGAVGLLTIILNVRIT